MIKKIQIKDIATYEDEIIINPTKINYFYGSNGSGKTTLSKIINDVKMYPSCNIELNSLNKQIMVYNRDFVNNNFLQSDSIKGIFTLGKDSKDAIQFIDSAKMKVTTLSSEILNYKNKLQEKSDEKRNEKNLLQDSCWALKKEFDFKFDIAFDGVRNSKAKFLDKCLKQINSSSNLLTEEELIQKYNKVFSNSLVEHNEIRNIKYDNLSLLEKEDILSVKIIGKEDLQIGKLIQSLNNSDWVKNGITYLNKSNSICPFCQQIVTSELKTLLDDFFDETYSNQCKALISFKQNYQSYIENLINELEHISKLEISILNMKDFGNKLSLIKAKFKSNLEMIDNKIKSPSIPIQLETLINDFSEVEIIIDGYIKSIRENNSLIKNITYEKTKIINEIWKYIYSHRESQIISYNKKISGIEKAEESINNNIKSRKEILDRLNEQINQKESEITSVIYTVNEINRILRLFGFNNFKLAEAEKRGFYKIIRQNGEDAQDTLSEGEYTFITFLYFYQLVQGSIDKTGVVSDRIVVIDDPISSLDSNILFIVSNLVKTIVDNCKNDKGSVKQVFILTHNVYFHKEITFKTKKSSNKKEVESFWVVRKLNGKSNIIKSIGNPIKTTYELLWSELYDPERVNTATIFNTLRRILEYYFNILGGLDYECCINKFEGEDKLVCKSLVSWTNDGSHFIGDSLEIPLDPEGIEKYLQVFKLIFDKMGHIEHYNMMISKESAI